MAEDCCSNCRRVTLAIGRPPLVLEPCPECSRLVCHECRIPYPNDASDEHHPYGWICTRCAADLYEEHYQ